MPNPTILEIKSAYAKFEHDLMKSGKLPMHSTDVGFWHGSNIDEIFQLFREIKLDRYKNFLDLGSGDGRVTLIASLFTSSTGIEFDKNLVEKAEEIKSIIGIKNAVFHQKNFYG